MERYEFRGLTKQFKHGKANIELFKDIDLTINRGEVNLITGKSGCGKSSLMWILAGIDPDFTGEVYRDGERVENWSSDISLIFQNHNLIPEWTALENCTASLINSGLSKNDQIQRATDVLEQVGLKDRLDHLPGELSIGQRQRVAIARSIVTEPKILLADEPLSGIDSEIGEKVVTLLMELVEKKDLTLIVSSHGLFPLDEIDRHYKLENNHLKLC